MNTELHALDLTVISRDWLVHRPIEIAVYVVLALLLRYGLHRLIDRMTRRARVGASALLRPLKARDPYGASNSILNARRAQRARTMGSVFKSGVSIATLTWAVLQILAVVGVNVAPLIASAGVIGVALGFGAQNLVRDFLTGVFMLLEDQYGVGDVVDVGDAVGTVETVGLRVTTVRDINGTLWFCRHGEIQRVGNMSQGHAVAVIDLPIAHTANVHRALQVALSAAEAAVDEADIAEDVLEPPEMLGVNTVTAQSVVLRLTTRTRPGRQWAVQRRLTSAALAAFDEAGIEAPLAVLMLTHASA
ncbi:mechanosensitive ion channel family protein [Rhodococcus sp. NM-2]|uniref:mechanosensitive ion channel family protein n=1 Tax=Rhodococcus sp. NM-2 TaxID=3401174 RepID=UPI003AB0D475